MYAYEDPHPALAGFGAASAAPRYYDLADPVAAFFRGWQGFLGVPQTGAWDRATHDAASAFLVGKKLAALPAWGASRDPAAYAYVWGIFDDLATGPLSGPIPDEPARMLQSFDLPAGDYADLRLVAKRDEAKIVAVQVAARDAILAAESSVAAVGCPIGERMDASGICVSTPATVDVRPVVPKAWYRRPSTWLAAGGVLLAGVVVVAATRRR